MRERFPTLFEVQELERSGECKDSDDPLCAIVRRARLASRAYLPALAGEIVSYQIEQQIEGEPDRRGPLGLFINYVEPQVLRTLGDRVVFNTLIVRHAPKIGVCGISVLGNLVGEDMQDAVLPKSAIVLTLDWPNHRLVLLKMSEIYNIYSPPNVEIVSVGFGKTKPTVSFNYTFSNSVDCANPKPRIRPIRSRAREYIGGDDYLAMAVTQAQIAFNDFDLGSARLLRMHIEHVALAPQRQRELNEWYEEEHGWKPEGRRFVLRRAPFGRSFGHWESKPPPPRVSVYNRLQDFQEELDRERSDTLFWGALNAVPLFGFVAWLGKQ